MNVIAWKLKFTSHSFCVALMHHRQADRQSDREGDKHRDRERETLRVRDRNRGIETDKQTKTERVEAETGRQADKQTDGK